MKYGNAIEIIRQYDIVIDGSDNFGTRYIINDTCLELNKVYIYGAIFQFEGHISVFNYQGGPNYRDFYNKTGNENNLEDTCSNSGVLGMLPGIIGTLQATEAIKIILGYKFILSGIILKYNALALAFDKFKIINTNFYLLSQNKQDNNNFNIESHSSLREINVLQLQQFLNNQNSRYLLIDVRNKEEYRKSHLANSLNIPLTQLKTQEYSDLHLKGKICFIYCSLDSRSIFASNFLIKKNLNIVRIQGGLNAWNNIIGMNDLTK